MVGCIRPRLCLSGFSKWTTLVHRLFIGFVASFSELHCDLRLTHPINPHPSSLCFFIELRPISALKTVPAYFCSSSLLSFKGISPRKLLALIIPSWHLLLIEPKLTHWISA